jgi:hypothetical protein
MTGFFTLVSSAIGGWLGWKMGMYVGLLTAYFLSVIGTAGGLVIGRRIAENLLE